MSKLASANGRRATSPRCVHSHIGYGAPHKQDSAAAHGEPLGVGEARAAKEFYGARPDASFAVPEGVREHFSAHFGQRGAAAHQAWQSLFAAYREQYPDPPCQVLAASFKTPRQALDCLLAGTEAITLPADIAEQMLGSPAVDSAIARFIGDWHSAYELRRPCSVNHHTTRLIAKRSLKTPFFIAA